MRRDSVKSQEKACAQADWISTRSQRPPVLCPIGPTAALEAPELIVKTGEVQMVSRHGACNMEKNKKEASLPKAVTCQI